MSNENISPEAQEAESLRVRLAEIEQKQRDAEARARNAEEAQAESERLRRTGGVELPNDEAGWRYARALAQANAQQNPDLAPAQQQVEAYYNNWRDEQQANREKAIEQKANLARKLDRHFPEEDAIGRRVVESALAGGMTYDQIEAEYLTPMAKEAGEEAGRIAEDETRNELGRRTAIEGGERSVTSTPDAKPEQSADEGVSASVADMFKLRAPSSQKIFG